MVQALFSFILFMYNISLLMLRHLLKGLSHKFKSLQKKCMIDLQRYPSNLFYLSEIVSNWEIFLIFSLLHINKSILNRVFKKSTRKYMFIVFAQTKVKGTVKEKWKGGIGWNLSQELNDNFKTSIWCWLI